MGIDMYVFVTLSDQEKSLIINLPIRVGIKIAKSDIEGDGDGATVKEIGAIKKALSRSIKCHKFSDVVKGVAISAAEKNINNIDVGDLLGDATKAYGVVKKHFSVAEVKAYKEMILEVGVCVARAYREEGDDWDDGVEESVIGAFSEKIVGFIKSITDRENTLDMNISPEEDTVLTDIALAMR